MSRQSGFPPAARPSILMDGEPLEVQTDDDLDEQYAYAIDAGIKNPLRNRLVREQDRAATASEEQARWLREAAAARQAGLDPVGKARAAAARLDDVMGRGASTAENMLRTAERLEQASRVLRDKQAYAARGLTGSDYVAAGGQATGLMAVPKNNRREIIINLDHDFFKPKPDQQFDWDTLRRAFAHEVFHSDVLRLGDENRAGQKAYRRGQDGRPNDAYRNLTVDEALANPDRLAAFLFGK